MIVSMMIEGVFMFYRFMDIILNMILSPKNRVGTDSYHDLPENGTKITEDRHRIAPKKKDIKGGRHLIADIFSSSDVKKPAIYMSSIAISMVFLSIFFRPVLITAIFTILAILTRLYQRFSVMQFGIDFALFGTVICAVLFGPYMGALVGLIAYPVTLFYANEDPKFLPAALLGMTLIAFSASSLPITPSNIFMWGMVLTLGYNLFTGAFYYYIHNTRFYCGFIFAITHIFFNYLLFSRLAEKTLLYLL